MRATGRAGHRHLDGVIVSTTRRTDDGRHHSGTIKGDNNLGEPHLIALGNEGDARLATLP